MGKKVIRLTEADIRHMVKNAYNNVVDKLRNASDVAFQGYAPKEGSPMKYEDIFENYGWKVYQPFNDNGITYYPAKMISGVWGGRYGADVNKLVQELQDFNRSCRVFVVNKNNTQGMSQELQAKISNPQYRGCEFFGFDF